MKVSNRRRTMAVAAASAALLALPLALPATAAGTPGQCTKLTTKTAGNKLTAALSHCTPVAATGGSGGGTFTTATGATSGTLNITITWAAKHGTTTGTVKFGQAKGLGKCPAGTTSRVALTGKVTGGTGTVLKTIKKGQAISGSVCVGKTTDSLEPGTGALKF